MLMMNMNIGLCLGVDVDDFWKATTPEKSDFPEDNLASVFGVARGLIFSHVSTEPHHTIHKYRLVCAKLNN